MEDSDNLGTVYDYGSVMHYEEKDFSENGQPTIKAINDPGNAIRLGQRAGLTDIDAARVNTLYQCDHGEFTMSFLSAYTLLPSSDVKEECMPLHIPKSSTIWK